MEDLLQCPICYNNYNHQTRTPRQLNNCQHILCSECLPYLIKRPNNNARGPPQQEYIECPMCKGKLYASIDQVPRSLVITKLMDAAAPATSNLQNQNTTISSPFPQPVIPPRPSYQKPTNYNKLKDEEQSSNPFYSNYTTPVATAPVQPPEPWDTETFLRRIFNEMDVNGDGSITSDELQEALKRGQSSNEFSQKTIQLLISRYDKNGDREISFEEFFDLYCNLNDEFENFLMMDGDGNGFIDFDEFAQAMTSRGYNFSNRFFKFIIDEIGKHGNFRGIKFDSFIRVMARFDYLVEHYKKTPYFHNKHNLESYLKNTFFQDFW